MAHTYRCDWQSDAGKSTQSKPDLLAQVGFGILAELTFSTLWHVQWNNVVSLTYHRESCSGLGQYHISRLHSILQQPQCFTKFKLACLVRQSLSRQAPVYLADDCCVVSESTRHSLRSADVQTCEVPWTYGTKQLWRQNFCSRWTSFVELFTSPTAQSRHHLPTVSTTAEETPFKNDGHDTLWLLNCSALEKHLLTYLLTYLLSRLIPLPSLLLASRIHSVYKLDPLTVFKLSNVDRILSCYFCLRHLGQFSAISVLCFVFSHIYCAIEIFS